MEITDLSLVGACGSEPRAYCKGLGGPHNMHHRHRLPVSLHPHPRNSPALAAPLQPQRIMRDSARQTSVGLHAMCRPVQVHATWARHASTRTEQNLAEQNSRIELIATTTCLFTAQFLFWTNPLGLADSTIRFGSPVANLVDIYSPALGPNILGHRS